MTFTKINPELISDNPFKLINNDWMLITAGDMQSFNTMTASWGGMGILWNKKVVFCFIRPTQYTFQFMEKTKHFTLSFFSEQYREALNFCGTKSGKNTDKMKHTGLTPIKSDNGSVYFKEARMVLECKKIYSDPLKHERFLDVAIEKNYPAKDYHTLYIGEITTCLIVQ